MVLSPKSKRIYDRQHRPSFQGLAVIEGNGQNEKYDESNSTTKAVKFKTDRRRRQSLDKMKSGAQSDQVRQIFDNALDSCVVTSHAPPVGVKDRVQAIMIKAKDSGMTTDNIFNFFNGGNSNTTHITKESFLDALKKLGETFLIASDEELSIFLGKMDKNGDDKISMAEFKNYCYSDLSSVSWKAERNRMERSGEMEILKAQISHEVESSDTPDQHICVKEVYHTSKIFWRTNNNVDIKLYYCLALDVITMQLFSLTLNEELPAIYVSKNQVDLCRASSPKIESIVNWDVIAKFLVTRLKLKGSCGEIAEGGVTPLVDNSHSMHERVACVPFLFKLTGDKFDNLMINKPSNLDPPPTMSIHTSTLDNFEETMASFQKVRVSARSSRKSAQELTSLVNSALYEVQNNL